ncbi:rab-GTPase-TBC domain-domain-containing protein [Yarrowia lipolytica]|uniref:YALI0A18700p n=2 Tax=Yarrowia lipolytica TaxID=4952 RepID=Q6CGJ8_YARLI|nr:YALI0A18700p [Yarrowia lipolytica CLIB122]RDW28092.1 rab-GTPase-TBC domain-domain-containing protein [Yarrowia lipolytica]RDW32050.1 rab-GTPase-TBC domain-domain-containing protein [Yarrowia lipolytica]RDW48390.1 rab-GTPase-TBC domain-domain-containing protein [Yarrowia lipolytica]RDW54795.1 rab-GTPase-TBC domain-domain-containing protein [Yarrowia lipolytica]CAG84147.1 YALI0A18700p [Yarrowia lipolytica CLIB122]|eukprot:XP_500214.1 YALI0A18700p [Yarrowia lipolytica CLIB122]
MTPIHSDPLQCEAVSDEDSHGSIKDTVSSPVSTQTQTRPAPVLRPRKSYNSAHTNPHSPAPYDTPLFSSLDEMPSALHNLSDESLAKMIDRHGGMFLVRQLSRDLAQREKEVVVMRKQHEDRERELKTMLVECDVSVIEIERRLSSMRVTSVVNPDHVINEALQEALVDVPQESESRSLLSITKTLWDSPRSARSLLSVKSSSASLKSFMDEGGDGNNSGSAVVSTSAITTSSTTTNTREEEYSSVKNGSLNNDTATNMSTSSDPPRSIEMTSIFDPSMAPPTLQQSRDLLTDRYGFKYDWKRSQKESARKPVSIHSTEDSTIDNTSSFEPVKSSSSSTSSSDQSKTTTKSSESKTTSKPISSAFQEPPSRSAPTATVSLTTNVNNNSVSNVSKNTPVKLLLSQLSHIHDTQQKAQLQNWTEFLNTLSTLASEQDENACTNLLGLGGVSLRPHNPKLYKSFVSLVLGGIPVKLRPQIWSQCSGAESITIPGLYQELLTDSNSSATDYDPIAAQNTSQIDLDLYRTMPHNIFFGKGPGVAKLRNVLVAVSRHNPDTGYCQGMNIMAAVLLLAFPTEEDAFWALVALTNLLPTDYLAPPLLTSRADQRVLKSYIVQHLPQINQHMDQLEIDLEAITFSWFLSCFADTLPPEVLFRIWDVFLCLEGMSFLFKTALALFKMHKSQLLEFDSAADFYTYIKNVGDKVLSVDNLIKTAEEFDITEADVEKRRKAALADLQ